jgi:hypothetical protein
MDILTLDLHSVIGRAKRNARSGAWPGSGKNAAQTAGGDGCSPALSRAALLYGDQSSTGQPLDLNVVDPEMVAVGETLLILINMPDPAVLAPVACCEVSPFVPRIPGDSSGKLAATSTLKSEVGRGRVVFEAAVPDLVPGTGLFEYDVVNPDMSVVCPGPVCE